MLFSHLQLIIDMNESNGQHNIRGGLQWSHVMFSDKSRFKLDFNDGHQRVWRHCGARCLDAATTPHDHYDCGRVTIWDGITMNGRTNLHICQDRVTGVHYWDNIIEPLVPFAASHGNNFIFQDDNAHVHCAHVILNHFQTHGIQTLSWPAMSPDVLPIQHV